MFDRHIGVAGLHAVISVAWQWYLLPITHHLLHANYKTYSLSAKLPIASHVCSTIWDIGVHQWIWIPLTQHKLDPATRLMDP